MQGDDEYPITKMLVGVAFIPFTDEEDVDEFTTIGLSYESLLKLNVISGKIHHTFHISLNSFFYLYC